MTGNIVITDIDISFRKLFSFATKAIGAFALAGLLWLAAAWGIWACVNVYMLAPRATKIAP